jgi:hypothetical protein
VAVRSELLEREAAVRRLEELALGVARGDGGVLVIESQAGSGKTALLGPDGGPPDRTAEARE